MVSINVKQYLNLQIMSSKLSYIIQFIRKNSTFKLSRFLYIDRELGRYSCITRLDLSQENKKI